MGGRSAGDDVPLLQLFHLDSGGGGMAEDLSTAQISWFNSTLSRRRRAFGKAVPALVFVHIPMAEFASAIGGGSGDRCFGAHDDDITPTVHNTGLFAALEARSDCKAAARA